MLQPEQPPSDLAVIIGGELALLPMLAITPELIEDAERRLIEGILSGKVSEVQCPLNHTFAPGVYVREIIMPAGSFIIGHEHKTQHVNMVLTGSAYVMMSGQPFHLTAPHTFVSEPGVRKVLFITEEMRFATVHPTSETDLDKLEELLIVKSATYTDHIEDVKRLRKLLTTQ